MRTSFLIVLFLFIVAVAAVAPGIAVASESKAGFVAWAIDRAAEMDLRWSRMTVSGGAKPSESRDGAGVSTDCSSASAKTVRGSDLSHEIISSRSFLHKVTTQAQFLPLSTRERNGASRGVSRLQSPAKARLSMPCSMRRPLNSSVQKKNFFRSFGTSVARPKLDSFGRIGRTGHTRSTGVSRPVHRWDRPRIL